MSSKYDELVSFVGNQCISEYEADHAIRRCIAAMAKNGIASYAGASAVAYFMNMTPASAVGFGVTTFTLGAGYAVVNSPKCSEVRSTIHFWNTEPI